MAYINPMTRQILMVVRGRLSIFSIHNKTTICNEGTYKKLFILPIIQITIISKLNPVCTNSTKNSIYELALHVFSWPLFDWIFFRKLSIGTVVPLHIRTSNASWDYAFCIFLRSCDHIFLDNRPDYNVSHQYYL